jgi:hypothetical protein
VRERKLAKSRNELDKHPLLDIERGFRLRQLPADQERFTVLDLPNVPPTPVADRLARPEPQVLFEAGLKRRVTVTACLPYIDDG